MKIALMSPAGAMHRYNGMFHKGLHYAPITLALLAALVPKELEAEVERLEAELAMCRQRDGRLYTRFVEAVERDYPAPGRGTAIGRAFWALVGWLVLAFGALFDGLGV